MVNFAPFWQIYLGPLLRSNFFIIIATFFAGFIVLRVYRNQQDDEKRNAANIILLEIEEAEEALRNVNIDKPFASSDEPDTILLKSASWDKYKHLFVADFAGYRDELKKISDFYDQCNQYDDAVADQNAMGDDNTRAMIVNLQAVLTKFAEAYFTEIVKADPKDIATLRQQYLAVRDQFNDIYMGITSRNAPINHYVLQKFTDNAKRALGVIDRNLSTSTAGKKLKEIAAPKRKLFILTK